MAALDPFQAQAVSGMMDQVLTSLNQAISDLSGKASTVRAVASSIGWSLLGPIGQAVTMVTAPTEDARNGINSALNTMRNIVSRLDTSSRQDVINGDLAADKWVASANEVMEGIKGLSLQLDEGTVWSNVEAACLQTLEDLKGIAKTVAPALGIGVGVIVSVAIGIVLLNSWLQGGGGHKTSVADFTRPVGGRRKTRGSKAHHRRYRLSTRDFEEI